MRILLLDSNQRLAISHVEKLSLKHTVKIHTGTNFMESMLSFCPDVVLLYDRSDDADSGISNNCSESLIRHVKGGMMGGFIHLIVATDHLNLENRLRLFRLGADAIIEDPISVEEIELRLLCIGRIRQQIDHLWNAQNHANDWYNRMEAIIRQKTAEISLTRNTTVFVIAKLAESRAIGTGRHLERIRDYCDVLTRELFRRGVYSEIDSTFIEDIYWASPLHDIGKIAIPDAILLKEGPLTSAEFSVMKQHSVVGATTLQQAMEASGFSSFLSMAIDIALNHHEKYNGSGYPDKVTGERIPISAQIVAVADVFDAISSTRVYKKAMEPELVRQTIERESGSHFNPEIVSAFTAKFDSFLEIYESHRDAPPEPMNLQDNFLMGRI